MPLNTTFLNTCRTRTEALSELATFRTQGALTDDTRSEQKARWGRLNSGNPSVLMQLRQAIRNMVNAEAEKHGSAGSGVITNLERESAYQTMLSEYVPEIELPNDNELAAWNLAVSEDQLL